MARHKANDERFNKLNATIEQKLRRLYKLMDDAATGDIKRYHSVFRSKEFTQLEDEIASISKEIASIPFDGRITGTMIPLDYAQPNDSEAAAFDRLLRSAFKSSSFDEATDALGRDYVNAVKQEQAALRAAYDAQHGPRTRNPS